MIGLRPIRIVACGAVVAAAGAVACDRPAAPVEMPAPLVACPSPDVRLDVLAEAEQQAITIAAGRAEANPDDAKALAELGVEYFASGFTEAAVGCFEAAAAAEPGEPRWFYRAGMASNQVRDRKRAMAHMEQVLRLAPTYAAAQVQLGNLLVEEDPARARKLFEQAIGEEPAFAQAHYGYGRAAKLLGDDAAAVEHFRKAVELVPGYAAAHYELAMALRDAGETQAAGEHLEQFRAGEDPPELHDPWGAELMRSKRSPMSVAVNANSLLAAGRLEEALDLLGPPREGEAAVVADVRGTVYLKQGRLQDAKTQFRAALEDDPKRIETRANLGMTLIRAGEIDEAERVLTAALERNPKHARSLQYLAFLLSRQGRSDEAIAALQRAVDAQPGRAEYRVELAGLLLRVGRRSDAERELNQALEIEPDHPKGRAMKQQLDRSPMESNRPTGPG